MKENKKSENNWIKPLASRWLACGILSLTSSCATMISGSRDEIKITSDPSGARVLVEPGDIVHQTPATLRLDRKRGPYRLTITKPGYQPYVVDIEAYTNGWVWGNILIGGIIGIAVDYSTGAATSLSPTQVHANLSSGGNSADAHSETEDKLYLFDDAGALITTIVLEKP